MAITIQEAAKMAKARTADKRWNSAIDRAVALSSQWLITELMTSTVITSESGETYFVTENTCQCRAFELNQPCKHRAYVALARLAGEAAASVEKSSTNVQEISTARRPPIITRSIERNYRGPAIVTVRCNHWLI